MKIIPRIEVGEAKDIVDFATTMDSDMNQYFKEKKELLTEVPNRRNENGVVFFPEIINPRLFYAYLLKGRRFKDGTYNWKVCLSCRENENNYMVLGIVCGTEEEAKQELERVMVTGKIY